MAKKENIKIIHLLTGEEILGEVTNETDLVISVKNPVRIMVVPTSDPSNPKVGFGPYTQWSDDKELTLNRSHVTFTSTPITEFLNQYSSMYGGLVVPPSTKIITP